MHTIVKVDSNGNSKYSTQNTITTKFSRLIKKQDSHQLFLKSVLVMLVEHPKPQGPGTKNNKDLVLGLGLGDKKGSPTSIFSRFTGAVSYSWQELLQQKYS